MATPGTHGVALRSCGPGSSARAPTRPAVSPRRGGCLRLPAGGAPAPTRRPLPWSRRAPVDFPHPVGVACAW
jgi:hypothetical protein